MNSIIQSTLSTLVLSAFSLSCHAATAFLDRGDADLSAKWEIWSFGDNPIPDLNRSGSQGPAQSVTENATVLNTSNLQTTIIDSYGFPGGFLFNPDTFYLHDGGANWDLTVELSRAVDYVRLSYSLVGGLGEIVAFPVAPNGPGLSEISSGSYAYSGGTAFFHDFALDTPSRNIALSFGDIPIPGPGGSFRSIDAVQLEAFSAAEPIPVPEPTSSLLLAAGGLLALRHRR